MRKRRRCFLLGGVVLFCCVTLYYPILLSIRPEEVEVWNMTRNMQVFVQPHNYTAIIGGEHFCHRNSKAEDDHDDIFLLVVVCSSTANFEARKAIRETWARTEALNRQPRFSIGSVTSPSTLRSGHETLGSFGHSRVWSISSTHVTNVMSELTNGSIRVLFMLGRTDNGTVQQLIHEESKEFRDIVQEDFQDTYNNLTLKSVMVLKWVNATCRHARYIMKTDDDTFVNVPRLSSHLLRFGRQRLLLGYLICGAVPVKNKNSKWYVPRVLYSERYYPNYLSGTGYIISNDLISPLYEMALVTPFFHLEDIYITGICAKRLGIKPVDYEGFTYQKRPNDPCLFHYAINGHRMSPADMRNVWLAMNAKDLKCDVKKIKLRDYHQRKCV